LTQVNSRHTVEYNEKIDEFAGTYRKHSSLYAELGKSDTAKLLSQT